MPAHRLIQEGCSTQAHTAFAIQGFQKVTLLDYPGKVASIVFAPGCNYRCPFCHNAGLVLQPDAEPQTSEAFFTYLEKRKGVLDGVCITGGEPTLQPSLPDFVRTLRAMGLAIKLDTNGSRPEMLSALLADQLVDYVAMDIKNSREGYARTTGVAADVRAVEHSAALLMAGTVPFEFRTTLVSPLHTATDMERIGQWLAGPETYFLQTFVDSGHLIGTGMKAFSETETQALLAVLQPYIPHATVR